MYTLHLAAGQTSQIPNRRRRILPPVFVFGWTLDAEHLRLARERRANHEAPHCSNEDAKKDGPEERNVRATINDFRTMSMFTFDTVCECGVNPAPGSHLQLCFAPDGGPSRLCRMMFSLYDNYHIDRQHSEEDVKKIKAAFGFEGEPR